MVELPYIEGNFEELPNNLGLKLGTAPKWRKEMTIYYDQSNSSYPTLRVLCGSAGNQYFSVSAAGSSTTTLVYFPSRLSNQSLPP